MILFMLEELIGLEVKMVELHGVKLLNGLIMPIYAALNCSLVHADQHGLYFRPGNPNQAIVVNDGGVAYASNLIKCFYK